MQGTEQDLLFLDGDCGLCHRLAHFLTPRLRPPDSLLLVPQASDEARVALAELPQAYVGLDSVFLRREGRFYARSEAALRALLYLGWSWRLLGRLLLLVPRPLRDVAYDLVARHRHRIFGPSDSCELPRPGRPEEL